MASKAGGPARLICHTGTKFRFVFWFSLWGSSQDGVVLLRSYTWRIHPKFRTDFRWTTALLFCIKEEISYLYSLYNINVM